MGRNINKKLTICSCVSRSFINREKVAVLTAVLRNEGHDVTVEPDLCKKMMQHVADTGDLASSIVLACYPRAVRSLFHRSGITLYQSVDIRNHNVQDILTQLNVPFSGKDAVAGKETAEKEIQSFAIETGSDAWYPVIDKDRCSECRQCHDFCLFGVYEIVDGEVTVKQPQNCKNNCPACARICPSKAVIFPKYEKSPINGGLEDEEIISVDMKAVYADALRTRLQQRKASVSLLKKDK